jgi:5-methylcytosine-specific restriction endonuclease McrA
MANATPPFPCSEANCGDLFPKCGIAVTYKAYGCRCEECRRARRENARQARANDPERVLEQERQYRERNRELVAERKRRYNEANREAITEYRRRDYIENHEAHLERSRKYRVENRDKVLESLRRWQADNKEAAAEYNRRYRAENREAVRERRRRYTTENSEVIRTIRQRRRARLKEAFVEDVDLRVLFKRDGYICAHCGIKCQNHTYPALNYATHDHIIPLSWGVSRGGFHSYANSQTLCYSCNSRKGNRNDN